MIPGRIKTDQTRLTRYYGALDPAWHDLAGFAPVLDHPFASWLKNRGVPVKTAWMTAMGFSAAVMGALALYHGLTLPAGSVARRPEHARDIAFRFWDEIRAFFQKPAIWGMLVFVFLYRSGEGFLLLEAPLFLQASTHDGGVGLTLAQKALIDGTVSNVMGIIAGLLSGLFIARFTLRRTLFVLALCMNVPHLVYIYMARLSPERLALQIAASLNSCATIRTSRSSRRRTIRSLQAVGSRPDPRETRLPRTNRWENSRSRIGNA